MYKTNSALPGTLTSLTGLAKTIALPHENAPMRYPSFPALERTAVMGFSSPTTWVTPAVTAARFMLSRQAVYPFWIDSVYSGTWSYSVNYPIPTYDSSTKYTFAATLPAVDYYYTGNSTAGSNRVGISGSATLPQCPYPVMAFDQGTSSKPFFWLPTNASMTVITTTTGLNSASAGTPVVTFEMWTSPGEVKEVSITLTKQVSTTLYGDGYTTTSSSAFSGSTAGVWIRPAAYVASNTGSNVSGVFCVVSSFTASPTYSWSGSTQPSLLMNGTSASAVHLPALTAPEYSTSQLPWYATRTTAASVLLTNTTQVLNKAGTFIGGRVSPNVISPFEVTRSYIANLHPAEKQQLCAEEGFYTFCPPSTDMANFWDYTLPAGNLSSQVPPPLYRLDNDALVNLVFFDDSSPANFSITVDWHIEFRTSSALWQIAVSAMPLETLHQAQLALHGLGYFFSNKHHGIIDTILGHLKSVSPVFGLVQKGVRAGQMLLSGRPQQAPRPTSGPRMGPGRGRPGPPRGGNGGRGRGGRGRGRQQPPRGPPPPRPHSNKPKMKSGLQMYLDSRKK
jgi:hypothetical protein